MGVDYAHGSLSEQWERRKAWVIRLKRTLKTERDVIWCEKRQIAVRVSLFDGRWRTCLLLLLLARTQLPLISLPISVYHVSMLMSQIHHPDGSEGRAH